MKKIKVQIADIVSDSLFPAVPLLLLLAITMMLLRKQYAGRDNMQAEETRQIQAAMIVASQYPDSIAVHFQKGLEQYAYIRMASFNSEQNNSGLPDSASAITAMLWKKASALSRYEQNRLASARMMMALNKMIGASAMQVTGKIMVITEIIIWSLFAGMSITVIYRYSLQQQKKAMVFPPGTMVPGKYLRNIPHTYKKRYRV